MTLTDPSVVGDSLIGFSMTGRKRVRVAVPLSQVAQLKTRQFSTLRTVLVMTPLVVAGLFIYGLSTIQW